MSAPAAAIDCQYLSAPIQPSLSWTAVTPLRRRHAQALAHRLEVLLVRDVDVPIAEPPARLLAENARRLSASVALDDSAVDVQVAVGPRKCGRVDPQGMRVVGKQRNRHLAGDLVERLLRRRRRPRRIPPASPAQPAALAHGPEPIPDASQRLLHGRDALQPNLPLSDRPRREVDMRIREARDDAASAEIDAVGARQRHLVRSDPARDPVACDRERGRSRERRLQRPHDASLENHGRER